MSLNSPSAGAVYAIEGGIILLVVGGLVRLLGLTGAVWWPWLLGGFGVLALIVPWLIFAYDRAGRQFALTAVAGGAGGALLWTTPYQALVWPVAGVLAVTLCMACTATFSGAERAAEGR